MKEMKKVEQMIIKDCNGNEVAFAGEEGLTDLYVKSLENEQRS